MSVCDMATVFMDITRDIFFNKNLNAIIIKYWPCSYWQYQCLTVKRCSFKVMKLSTAHLNGTCPKRSMSALSVNRILLFPFLILNYDRFKTAMKKGISKWDKLFFFLFTAKVIVYHEIPDPVLYSIVKLSVKKKAPRSTGRRVLASYSVPLRCRLG